MLNRFLTDEMLKIINSATLLTGLVMVFFAAKAGQPVGGDFYCFWSAGKMALQGDAVGIFDIGKITKFQAIDLNVENFSGIPWFYPPLLLLYISCLFALLPYPLAFALYLLACFGGYFFAARWLFPQISPLRLFGFPALWISLGQNGVLTAIILVVGLELLERSERWAGATLGLLSYKPQFCFAIPLFLLIERRFQAIATGIATLALLVLVTTLSWGTAIWPAFVEGLREAQNYNQLGDRIKPDSFAHLYGMLRTMGVAHATAMPLNYLFAAGAAVAAIFIWLKSAKREVRHSAVVLLSLLLAPHLLYYDFVVTGAVIVWLWPHERIRPALVLLWLTPALGPALAKIGVPAFSIATAVILYELVQFTRAADTRAVAI